MKEDWEDLKEDPLTPEELQRTRMTLTRVDQLWTLWGWLASAVRDYKAWAAFIAVAGFIWGEQLVAALGKLVGVLP